MSRSDLTKVSIEVLKAKSRAKLMELALESRASVADESGGLCQKKQIVNQVGLSGAYITKKLHFILDYVRFVKCVK